MRCLPYLAAATFASFLLTACTGPEDPGRLPTPIPETSAPGPQTTAPSPEASATSTAGTGDTVSCESRADGYAVDHPEAWSPSSAPRHEPCRWFSPEPIAPDEEQSPADIPIRLFFVALALDDVERLEAQRSQVVTSDRREVDGQPAVRQELRAVGQGLLPEGTRSTQWLVDFGSRTLVATTSEAATAGTYEQNAQVLDAMMRSLRRIEAEPVACSARDLPPEPEPQPGLPEVVQDARREIYLAAVQCDFDRLAELAPEQGFTYSFGGGEDPAGFWRRAELQDDAHPPMRYLAGVLQRPFGTREVQGTTRYLWPSAFVYDSWADVPQRDREALEPLYDEEDFEGFEQFGGYVGYRVVIAANGTWQAFVAGD